MEAGQENMRKKIKAEQEEMKAPQEEAKGDLKMVQTTSSAESKQRQQ